MKLLKTMIQPNTITTLNFKEIMTLSKMQQASRIPWVHLIFNYLCPMSKTKQVVPTMPDNIWRILEAAKVLMKSFALNHSPKQYN